jgi:hypothetical protein
VQDGNRTRQMEAALSYVKVSCTLTPLPVRYITHMQRASYREGGRCAQGSASAATVMGSALFADKQKDALRDKLVAVHNRLEALKGEPHLPAPASVHRQHTGIRLM